MTAPIPVYENSTIAGSRRTERGACYLTPNSEVRAIILYLFIHYAKKYKIRLLVLCIMSNHVHWVADDPDADYPQFLSALYSRITEVLNDYYGRTGPLWANCKPQRTRLLDDETIEEKLLYAATNPTWHGIEARSRSWPGLVFSPEDVGREVEVECPQYLLDHYKSFPERHTYVVPRPSCYAGMTDAKIRRRFRKKRNAREQRIRKERRGRAFLGADAALNHGPEHIPAPTDDHRELQNRLFDGASADIIRSAHAQLQRFRGAYAHARKRFTDGDRDVLWPRGSWAVWRWHRCPTC